MASVCAASFCGNSRYFVKKYDLDIVFHKFPANDQLLRKWVKFCNRDDSWTPEKNHVVCSTHFLKEDYQLICSPNKENRKTFKKLKPTAATTESELRLKERNLEIACVDCTKKDADNNTLAIQLKKAQEKNSQLTEVNKFLSKQLEVTTYELNDCKQEIVKLKADVEKLRKSTLLPENFKERMKRTLKDTLTSNQIEKILKKKKRIRWTVEEISKFFTLRYFGKRSYKYMATDLNYPLPSFSTLQRYAQKLELKEGILKDVLVLLKNITHDLHIRDRECVLSFDEMKVNKILEYDPASDEILGPYNNMQVVMARGLFKNWKQPIFIGFDQRMTKDILLEIVKHLSIIGINVVAIVSDNCQSNIGCWKDLGAHDYLNPYFLHPCTNSKIYVFPDAPHLLKLIRNWLLDTGFEYDNKIIKRDLLDTLVVQRNKAEFTPLFKITNNHLNMSPQERQNVRRAAELLSRTTAICLKRYFPDNTEANELALFLEKVDLWFSISNSLSPNAKLDYKKSYNANDNQKQALRDMFELVSNMKAIGKRTMQVFQKSILMHITSLQLLFEDMKTKHGINFISTHKLNQDVLENFFSQIRQKGGAYDHPSPLSCLYRIRMMIIGKSPTILNNHSQEKIDTTDGSDEPHEEFLSAAVFSGTDIAQTLPDIEAMININEICQGIDDNSYDTVSTVSSNDVMQAEQESDGLQYVM
uniref:THAP-type domain-containing protein n=1 Tax=Anopheles epiroticus TaxID=199890 RepID=A0A182PUU2_9DIPT